MTGRDVREMLLSKGVILSELADNLGITAQTLNSRLNAKHFKDEYLKEISNVLNITFETSNVQETNNLMQIIESQQRTIETLSRTIENLSKK